MEKVPPAVQLPIMTFSFFFIVFILCWYNSCSLYRFL